jgi:DNA-nicking Smr family endonuclease
MGNCLAGDTCIFSHDPSNLVSNISLSDAPAQDQNQQWNLQDFSSFPSLMPPDQGAGNIYGQMGFGTPPGYSGLYGEFKPRSRPSSQHHSREPTPAVPSVDDQDAFPSLGSAGKGGKKHHGKRGGHGHGHKEAKENYPSSLADVVRMSPSPNPSQKGGRANQITIRSTSTNAASLQIPAPVSVPWLETGDKANKAYLKARASAIKHGGLRNKFLQSAAQAWNRNDARAAKVLSLRGQSENDLMKKAHREAARFLYEERNKDAETHGEGVGELYVDLHGLHPEEAVEYLEKVLLEQQNSSRPVYAITGTGHHSKNGKDKVGKAIRAFLDEWRYGYREFSVPGKFLSILQQST